MSRLNPNKHLKEEFVSNLNGSSKLEIASLSTIIPAFVIIRMSWNAIVAEKKISRNDFWWTLSIDTCFVVLPILVCLTVLAEFVYIIEIIVLFVLFFSLFQARRRNFVTKQIDSRKLFLSYYRLVMMLVTCVTILAVDFTIYPRRYAKTETYGSGLMDLGVGSFVAANAMVSRQARETKRSSVLKSVGPLLILGFGRLLSTHGIDYQVHVGEYGVHWNFFFTLAAVSLLTSTIHISPRFCGGLGLVFLTVYQYVLLAGLNTYLLSAKRGPDLISMNKEGLFSIFGYWSLYLLSVQLGHHFFHNSGGIIRSLLSKMGSRHQSKWLTPAEIWFLDTILWLLVLAVDKFVEPISRRMCNMAYVMLVLAQNVQVIGIFAVAELFFQPKLLLHDIIDQNLLLTFLVANCMTGLMNMCVDTIFVTAIPSLLLLTAYMLLLIGIMASFKRLNLRW